MRFIFVNIRPDDKDIRNSLSHYYYLLNKIQLAEEREKKFMEEYQ